jgi:transposase
MRDKLYDTDLSDTAWAIVAPLLPPARPGGRPRTTCLREHANPWGAGRQAANPVSSWSAGAKGVRRCRNWCGG